MQACLRHRPPRISEYSEEKRTEDNLIVRSGKPEAEVTNNRSLCSTHCTIEANTTDRHEASRGPLLSVWILCNRLSWLLVSF